jgi:hypothetical protein
MGGEVFVCENIWVFEKAGQCDRKLCNLVGLRKI